MKKYFLLGVLLASCSLISPYTITFTTQENSVVDPLTDTLDFVVSAPTLAYISAAKCADAEPIELLPILTEDMVSKTSYNLSLALLKDELPQSECTITVTAFDQTTTSSARAKINLVIAGEIPEESTPESVIMDEIVPEHVDVAAPTESVPDLPEDLSTEEPETLPTEDDAENPVNP